MRRRLAAIGMGLCALALGAPCAVALRAPHSGWHWGDPHPQGETLWDVGFSGRTGYAVGDFGTLLKTTDRGRTWSLVATDFYQYLDQLQVISARSFVVGGGCWLLRSDDGGATLHRIMFGPCDRHVPSLVDVDFPTARRGYLFRDGRRALRTSDRGLHWEPIDQGLPNVYDSEFTARGTGVVVGQGYGYDGAIARTTDGGETWRTVAATSTPIEAVTFPTRSVGYAVGRHGVMRSRDGGRTWTDAPARARFLGSIACSDARHCVTGRIDGPLAYTDDGFETSHRAAPSGAANALAYSAPGRVVAVGEGGRMRVSADGGRSYRPLWSNVPMVGDDLRAATTRRTFAAGDGVSLTSDGGRTWRVIASPIHDVNLTAAWFFGDAAGYAAEDRRLFVTRDGGASWSRRPRMPVNARDLWSSADGRVVLTAGHRIARSTDAGRSFRPIRQTTLPRPGAWRFQQRQTGGALFAFGRSRIASSVDGGAHWDKVPGPPGRRAVKRISFPTPRTGYATIGDGRLWRTSNGGRRWSEIVSTGADPRLDLLSFGDARHGWIVPRDFADAQLGWMLRTDDGGRTWRPQAVGQDRMSPGDLVATGPFGGIASTIVGHTFYTHTAGDRGRPSTLTLASASSRVPRGTRVRLSGRLRPARRAAEVWVSLRGRRGTHWTRVATRTDARGAFHVDLRVDRPTYFVAQWTGYGGSAGAGSRATLVRVSG